MNDEPSGRSRGVDILSQATEARAAFLHLIHDVEKIVQGGRQASVFGDTTTSPGRN